MKTKHFSVRFGDENADFSFETNMTPDEATSFWRGFGKGFNAYLPVLFNTLAGYKEGYEAKPDAVDYKCPCGRSNCPMNGPDGFDGGCPKPKTKRSAKKAR